MGSSPSDDTDRPSSYAYFVIRTQRAAAPLPAQLAGIIEQLGTGEKQSFASGQELLNLVTAWPKAASAGDHAPGGR
jgi:hypothetical protein